MNLDALFLLARSTSDIYTLLGYDMVPMFYITSLLAARVAVEMDDFCGLPLMMPRICVFVSVHYFLLSHAKVLNLP